MKLILMGAPGAGKGTHGAAIRERYHLPVISTGDLIRKAMQAETKAGEQAKAFVSAGKLVPDEMVIAMLEERLQAPDCQKGYILDGFPRTIAQAQALEEMGIVIDRVIDLEVEDEVIVQRLAGRLVCRECGATYHIQYSPPTGANTCDHCNHLLSRREDDEPATILERLRIYHEQTKPSRDYYASRGKLYPVKGQDTVEATSKLVLAAVGS